MNDSDGNYADYAGLFPLLSPAAKLLLISVMLMLVMLVFLFHSGTIWKPAGMAMTVMLVMLAIPVVSFRRKRVNDSDDGYAGYAE
jgi:hypothetical protein